ncbi:pectinesterase family protein, partial [Cytophaga aurantiaca]|uniref:pectinesterase family protein n=1 Tax=Cytophaga aurantiaca TaxID=29530 RepID=UPI001FE2410E
MKGFSILSQFKYIIFILFIVGFSSLHTNAQSPIQNQLGTNIKFTVAKDGSGNYTTVQAAINAIPNNSTTPQVIFIKKGTYTEKVEIPSTKTHLVLIGEDVASTIIAYGDYSGSGKIYNGIITYANGTAIGTSTSHTLYAAAPDFTMMNITVINTAGDVGQAVALNSNADRQFYYHCKITGHQDTYLTWAGTRYYLKDCYLEGAVDYIFGAGVALFDSCQLNSVRSATCITAASTVQNFKFGYVFQNCKITSNSGVTGVFLGRPWRPYCQVVFINSEESSVIDPAGWSKWSGNTNDQTCYYAEYKNCGPGSGTANRATWTYQLTTAQAATYTRTNIFDKNVNPTPFTANWDPNPEGDIFYNIVNNNTTPFITSACFTTVTQPPVPKKYIYNYDNSGNLSWTNTNSWTPKAVPTSIDTVIIRSGEVQIANLNQTAPVMVEPNGTLRLIASSTLNDLRLQGGMLKVSTSNPEFDLQANITVEQPSSIQAGSVPATIFGINGTIKGSANLTKTSVGILLINSDASAFKGKWIVQSGVLKIASVTGMGVCGVHVNAAARLNIQTPSTAAIYSLKIDTTGGIDLNNNLTTEVTILGSTNLLAGSFKTANYPAYIGSTGTLKVNKSILSLNGPATFCQGNSVTLASASGVAYSWLNNNTQVSTNTTYTTNTAGAYSVYVTNSSGCTVSSAPVKTTVNLIPTATITAPATSFCTGGSVVLTASTGASYKWFNGTTQVGTAATYTATTVGSYTVEVTNASGCKATSAATTITISVAPTATITTPATSFCTGGSVVLTASTSASYKWFNGSTQVGTAATYTATAAGTYTVEITNASGCKATSAVTQISVSALPTATITSPATSFCTGGSVVLTTSTSASYKWFNGTTQVGTAASYTATAAG